MPVVLIMVLRPPLSAIARSFSNNHEIRPSNSLFIRFPQQARLFYFSLTFPFHWKCILRIAMDETQCNIEAVSSLPNVIKKVVKHTHKKKRKLKEENNFTNVSRLDLMAKITRPSGISIWWHRMFNFQISGEYLQNVWVLCLHRVYLPISASTFQWKT